MRRVLVKTEISQSIHRILRLWSASPCAVLIKTEISQSMHRILRLWSASPCAVLIKTEISQSMHSLKTKIASPCTARSARPCTESKVIDVVEKTLAPWLHNTHRGPRKCTCTGKSGLCHHWVHVNSLVCTDSTLLNWYWITWHLCVHFTSKFCIAVNERALFLFYLKHPNHFQNQFWSWSSSWLTFIEISANFPFSIV